MPDPDTVGLSINHLINYFHMEDNNPLETQWTQEQQIADKHVAQQQ